MYASISKNLQRVLSHIYSLIFTPKPPNLVGDRDVENAFVAANIPNKKGYAMDFGAGNSFLSLIAALEGYQVTSVDLLPNRFTYKHKNINYIEGDIFRKPIRKNSLDLIINCSSIEHVGLSGRYGIIKNKTDDDILTMESLSSLLKNSGVMILTVPIGKDKVIPTMHRVYGKKRLGKLLANYRILKEVYWTKDNSNTWITTTKQKAILMKTSDHFYNLGCFILRSKT